MEDESEFEICEISDFADQKSQPLSWEQRVLIAQDISRGLEYLHEGVRKLFYLLFISLDKLVLIGSFSDSGFLLLSRLFLLLFIVTLKLQTYCWTPP